MTIKERIAQLEEDLKEINGELEPVFLKTDKDSLAKKEELKEKFDNLKADIATLEKLAKDLVDNEKLEDPEFVSGVIAGYIENYKSQKEENESTVQKLSVLAPYTHQFKFLSELCSPDLLINDESFENAEEKLGKRITELLEYAERFFPENYLNSYFGHLSEWHQGDFIINYIKDIKEKIAQKWYKQNLQGYTDIQKFNKFVISIREQFLLDFLGRFPAVVMRAGGDGIDRFQIDFSYFDRKSTAGKVLDFGRLDADLPYDYLFYCTAYEFLQDFGVYFYRYSHLRDEIDKLNSEITRLSNLSPEEKKTEVRKRTESFEFPKLVKPIGNSTAETVKYFGAKLKELQALKGDYCDIMDVPECKVLRDFQVSRNKVYSDAELKELYAYDYEKYGNEVAKMVKDQFDEDEYNLFITDNNSQDFSSLISGNRADLKTTDVAAFRKKFLSIVDSARKNATDEIDTLTSQKQNNESAAKDIENSSEQELYRKVDGPNGEKRYAKFKLLFKIFNRKKYNENKTKIDDEIAKLKDAAKNADKKIGELKNLNTTRGSISSKIKRVFEGPGCSKVAELGKKFGLYLDVSKFYDTQEKRDNISRMGELHKQKEELESELIKELDAKIAECQNTGQDDLLEELQYIRYNVTSLNSGDLSENMQATLAARETAYTSLSERYGEETAEELVSGNIPEADTVLGITR